MSLHKSQLLDSLENKVLYADFCALVIGERGMGKSFFLNQLVKRLESQVCISQIEALPDLTYAQIEQSVSMQLGLNWQINNQSLLDRIAARIEQRVLLCIDNAHFLSPKCLESLMELVQVQLNSSSIQLFIVMTGETRLAEKLNDSLTLKNNPNCCVVFELQPINQSETKYLIAEFQSIDVGTAEALYDEQRLSYFWQLSKGIPIELEYQLNRWLSEKAVKTELEPEQAHNKHRKYWVSAGYAALALLLAVTLIYQDSINDMMTERSDETAAEIDDHSPYNKANNVPEKANSVQNNAETSLAQTRSENVRGDNPQIDPMFDNSKKISNLETNTKSGLPGGSAADDSQSLGVDSQVDLDSAPGIHLEEVLSSDNNAASTMVNVGGEKAEGENAEGENAEGENVDVLGDFLAEKALSSSDLSPPTHQPLKPGAPVKEITSPTGVTRTPGPASSTALAAIEIAQGKGLTAEEKKLLEADDEQFTLQWVAVSSLESANRFRDDHPLKAQLSIFRRSTETGYLYFVISGRYNSPIDAENTMTIYQRRSYPGKPWMKSFKAVKKDILGLQQ